VPVDREETLRKAEKLLKQGKVADAIAEYVRLVEDKPGDWNSVNTLGDLYLKAGQAESAAEQFTRAGDHLYEEGFFSRASALYKKVLKVKSADDHALWQLADIAGRNRLSLDARTYYGRLMQDRRAAGNEQGAVDCVIRLGLLDDASVDARRAAVAALVERGDSRQAARLTMSIADLFTKQERHAEAFEVLKEAAQLDPHDQEIQEKLAAATPIEETAPVEDHQQRQPEPEPELQPEPVLVVDAPMPTDPVEPEPVERAPASDDDVIDLEIASSDSGVVIDQIASVPDAGSEPLPLESFFEELRGKVARDQEVRARAHLERGLQHLEEGRTDEALTSLEEASRIPAFRFQASSHLARLCLGRGDLPQSIEWMERALEAPAPTVEDRLAVMYDLGATLAGQGETARALGVFMEVESESSGYRDVRDRIALLSQAEIGNP
jgi:tetratricopeptide (TPR) repeat protein